MAFFVLFVVLPLVLAPIVIWFVGSRSPSVPPSHRISSMLQDGEPARAEVLAWKNKGPFLLDSRPMVAFTLAVHTNDGEDFELALTQSIPRELLRRVTEGITVDVRLAPDRSTGAIVLPLDGDGWG